MPACLTPVPPAVARGQPISQKSADRANRKFLKMCHQAYSSFLRQGAAADASPMPVLRSSRAPQRCFNCGSYGHALRECWQPRDRAAVEVINTNQCISHHRICCCAIATRSRCVCVSVRFVFPVAAGHDVCFLPTTGRAQ